MVKITGSRESELDDKLDMIQKLPGEKNKNKAETYFNTKLFYSYIIGRSI